MNRKGQALVEFIVILPIFIMMVFAVIDFGLIFFNKCSLESMLNDTVNMVKNEETESNILKFLNNDKNSKVKYNVIDDDKYKTIEVYTSIKLMTPVLNKVLDNPYKISVKRVIYE